MLGLGQWVEQSDSARISNIVLQDIRLNKEGVVFLSQSTPSLTSKCFDFISKLICGLSQGEPLTRTVWRTCIVGGHGL